MLALFKFPYLLTTGPAPILPNFCLHQDKCSTRQDFASTLDEGDKYKKTGMHAPPCPGPRKNGSPTPQGFYSLPCPAPPRNFFLCPAPKQKKAAPCIPDLQCPKQSLYPHLIIRRSPKNNYCRAQNHHMSLNLHL